MTQLSTEDRVMMVLENLVMNEVTISEDSTWDSIGINSLDKIELIMDLEDEFSIEIPDETLIYLESVDELMEYIKRVTAH